MPTDLKASIRKALAGSSSQQPVDVGKLYKLGDVSGVQAVLMEMYRNREACCCVITRRDKSFSVWWLVGGVSAPHSYRKPKTGAA